MGTTLSLRTGQLAADTEFINAKYTDVFTNASMGWPAITSVNLPSGGPSPPLAALDARLRADLTDNCTVSAAIFDGNAAGPGLDDPQLRDNHGVNFRINDPLLLIGEVEYIWTAPIRTFASAEGETLLASPHGIHVCTDEIADRFMNRIKNPDRSEIAEAMLQGEFLRVPSVRLDPGLQAIGNGAATVLPCRDRWVVGKRHNAAAGLVAERQATALIGQPFGEFRNIRVLVDAALSPMDAARRCLMCSRPIWVGVAHS